MSQITLLRGQSPQSIAVGDAGAAFTNNGPDIVYYGGPTVSSGSSLGSIGVGSTVSLTGSPYLVLAPSASRADLTITAAAGSGVGIELGYAQVTAGFVGTANTAVDVPGLSVTIVEGSRPYVLRAWCYTLASNTLNSYAYMQIAEGSTVLALAGCYTSGVANTGDAAIVERRMPVGTSGASRTFKVQLVTTNAAVPTLGAAATAPAFIQAVEV